MRTLRSRLRRSSAGTAPGSLDLGSLRRVTPISDVWGVDRGSPIDRYYIDGFLSRHAGDIRGRVLEIADDRYASRFGGDAIIDLDILHGAAGNPAATLVGDLSNAPEIPDAAFDCVICTQTLFFIYDFEAALTTLHRILAPGGVVFVTVPGTSRICESDGEPWSDYWRFTSASMRKLFEETFPGDAAAVEAHGNVLAAAAMLYGIAAEELTREELDANDPRFEVLVAVRAQKA